MAGRMAGQRARVDPGDRLLTINFANLRRADRQYAVDEQHVAPAAIAGVVQCGFRQPVSAFREGGNTVALGYAGAPVAVSNPPM